MGNCNCKPPKKPPFPAISAHFAHTLDDMEEKYVKLQFIDISKATGIIEKDKLDLLLKSREKKIVFNSDIYTLTTIDGNIYTYIHSKSSENEDYISFNSLQLNKETGEYSIRSLKTKDDEVIQNLSYEVAQVQETISALSNQVHDMKANINNKVGVSVVQNDDNNVTLKLFN